MSPLRVCLFSLGGGGVAWQRELLFLFDTNFSTMCPQETCGSEWFQRCFGRAQEKRGTLVVPEEFGGAITLTLGEHSQAENSGGSDRPRPRRSPTLTAAHPHRPSPGTQGSMLPPGQRRAPSLPPGSSARGGGGDGWRSRHLRTCPVRGSAPGSSPTGDRRPRPCRSRPAPPAWAARCTARPL